LIVLLTPAWLSGQTSSSSPHDHQSLAGAWTLDESGPEEKGTNWNRPPRGLPPSSACQPIEVPEPKLDPVVKDINRTYTRAARSGGASWTW
jgi:hypothetical protein